jgi:hypothetical protein
MQHSFKNWLLENFGSDYDYSSLTPHHTYKTKDGHEVNIHVFNNPNGKHAVFHNKSLGGVVTKIVHWNHTAERPSMEELVAMGKEDEELNEEAKALTGDSAGRITEHSAIIHMIGHKHAQNKTHGSPEHQAEIAHHEEAIKKLGGGAHPHQVETRVEHGKAAAAAALASIKSIHGPHAKIESVAHTSKRGDIEKFTKGVHKDTQENPSDMGVEVSNSDNHKNKNKRFYHGYSLKSSAKASNITAKNPGIHMHGILDVPSRKLNAEKVSRDGIKDVVKKMGHEGVSAADRGRMISKSREEEGTHPKHADANKRLTKIEAEANVHGRTARENVATELHDHIHHLVKNGHHDKISGMLKSHLTAETSMRWDKIHVKGDNPAKVKASVTPGSESPLSKIFNDPKSKYAVSRKGSRVTVHHVDPTTGDHTDLAHYSPKTKSNIFKSDVHNWNVMPGHTH